ncbi:hypothetical protein G7K_4650-t1 [Saitoella complicata NRRL Y-17804]|uniref:RTA1 domain protein n=1 Tax=Saitoella complicata (strain BCRC 22490 / CBS 7301 / JCM 7358 / NBRC 10748 / NRRL Y-17804) TaxID=698492 RepID=A0A0E9NLH3_SAICN|nr:hypothetical protein G7K_4650-t1 [Saitoella complicata NRRL Y-17804]
MTTRTDKCTTSKRYNGGGSCVTVTSISVYAAPLIDIEYYQYEPSAGAAWTFVVLFGLATVFHVVLLFIIRAWYFIPLIIGGVCETFGYFGRAWSHREPNSIKPWVTQELLILCAPPLVAATVYMILSRLVRALQAEPHSMIRPARITFIFVFNDVVTLLTQIAGAGVQVTGDQHVMNIGKKAVIAGLMIGIFVFALFILLTSKVHVRLKKHSTPVLKQNPHLRWKRYMWMLYIRAVKVGFRDMRQ